MLEPSDEDDAVWRSEGAVARAIGNGCQEVEIEAAITLLDAVPEHRPELGELAARLLAALIGDLSGTPMSHSRHLGRLIAMADRHPPADANWYRVRVVAQGLAMQFAVANGKPTEPIVTVGELDSLMTQAGDDPALRAFLEYTSRAVPILEGLRHGDDTAIRDTTSLFASVNEQLKPPAELWWNNEAMSAWTKAVAANQSGDLAPMRDALDRMREATGKLPPDHHLRRLLEDMLRRSRPLFEVQDNGTVTDDQLEEFLNVANRPGVADDDRILDRIALGAALLRGSEETDQGRIEGAVDQFRKALELTTADGPYQAFCLVSLALGLFRRAEVAGTTAGLSEARETLDRARKLMGGPQHPQWALASSLLSEVHRRLGHNADARAAGRDSQRSLAWRVLLHSDRATVGIAAKDAVSSAIDVARRCIGDNRPGDALAALDGGRGLMLFSATALRGATQQLEAAGRPDLARRWEQTPDAHRRDLLRREVLTVLSQRDGPSDRLLDPPGLAEIQSALRALTADALVYLVPGEPGAPGLAIIAPVEGPVRYMALPSLELREGDDVERYLTALADRSRDLTAPGDHGEFSGKLRALCDWAWRAAIGPLLERGMAAGDATSGEIPHIVLIPMGGLARIPWQAARRGDGTYAAQLVAFSQAAAARMMCDNAFLAPVALSSTGLVVGDPDTAGRATDLFAARVEAYAIRRAFYRGARYLGRRPDSSPSPSGAGTAEQIRQWLIDPQPAAGGMLHLACHGSLLIEPELARSYLLLASAQPLEADELSAEELIEHMAMARQRDIALVVLAACNSGRSIHGYDEAYSLGTAFLSGGTRTVLSTQWSVPDQATSSLMFMFHYYLRDQGLPPVEALRRAQVWMLDPDRLAPQQMPAELRPTPDSDPTDVVAWAGFVHWGQ